MTADTVLAAINCAYDDPHLDGAPGSAKHTGSRPGRRPAVTTRRLTMAGIRDVASGLRYSLGTRTYYVFDGSGAFVIDTPFSETAIHWWRLHHPEADGPDIEPAVVQHRGSCSECPGCAVLRQADRGRDALASGARRGAQVREGEP